MFNFTYEKTTDEIKTKAREKIVALKSKNEDREARVARVRKEHNIDDLAMAGLYEARHRQGVIQQGSYSFSNSSVPAKGEQMMERSIEAGVVNLIFTEKDAIAADKASVVKLELVISNLRPLDRVATETGKSYTVDGFSLSEQELKFLGF